MNGRFSSSLAVMLLAATSVQAEPSTLGLSGRVLGASGKHVVHVALWRREGFLQRPVAEVRVEPQAPGQFEFKVSPGSFALSAFEDKNGNGVLDMGLFGPKEPFGFWRPFTGWRKPAFDDVAVLVKHDVSNADIGLR